MVAVFKYIKGCCKEGSLPFSASMMDKTKNNGLYLWQKKILARHQEAHWLS